MHVYCSVAFELLDLSVIMCIANFMLMCIANFMLMSIANFMNCVLGRLLKVSGDH